MYLQNAGDPTAQGWGDSTFGQGTQIGTSGWYCVYNGLGSGIGGGSVEIDCLQPSTTYRVMVVTYNGFKTGAPTYFTTTTSGDPMNYPPRPTVQASSVTLWLPDGWTTNLFASWNNGSGEATAVFMAATAGSPPAPVDGTVYLQNAGDRSAQGQTTSVLGQGTQIDTSGWYCVYNGPNNAPIMIMGIQPGTTYQVMAVTYNGVQTGVPTYLTSTASGNPAYFLSAMPLPATPRVAQIALGLLLRGAGLFRIVKMRGENAR